MPTMIAVVGSPRPGGNINYLVDRALEEARVGGVETEKIEIARYAANPC